MKLESPPRGHVYRDMSFDEYVALDGMNASQAKLLAQSPSHWAYNRDNPVKPTFAMRLGSLVHTLVLEPWAYEERYFKYTKVNRSTKAGKEYMLEVEETARLEGKQLISEATVELARAIRDSVLEAVPFLPSTGDKELSLLWKQPDILHDDEEIQLKARLDWCDPKANQIIDLKVMTGASPEVFARLCRYYQYEMQAAHYSAGFVMACQPSPGLWANKLFETKLSKVDFRFVVVESKPPHAVGVYRITHNDLEIGRSKLRAAAELYGKYAIDGEVPSNLYTEPEGEDLQIYRG